MTNFLICSSIIFFCLLQPTFSQEERTEHVGIGIQRPAWPLFGPSVSYDFNRYFGLETVFGVIRLPDAAAKYGVFERLIIRPVHLKTNNLYIYGSYGIAKVEYWAEGFVYIEEPAHYLGAYIAAELDLRTFFTKFIALYANGEFGIEYSSAGYLHSEPYPSFGFGVRYKF